MLVAKLGPDRRAKLRKDWEALKEALMLEALRADFSQHEDSRSRLLSTADTVLVEHTYADAHWGDRGDGGGKNRLEELLMKVRSELAGGS